VVGLSRCCADIFAGETLECAGNLVSPYLMAGERIAVGWNIACSAALAAAICLGLRRWRAVALYGVCFVVVLEWWVTLQPSNDRDWADDVARTASGIVRNDKLLVPVPR
jgi:hypothetical protein